MVIVLTWWLLDVVVVGDNHYHGWGYYLGQLYWWLRYLSWYYPRFECTHYEVSGWLDLWLLVWVVLYQWDWVLRDEMVIWVGLKANCFIIAGLGVKRITGVIPWEGYFGCCMYVH